MLRKKEGFTLIELLVVIAIIGILASIVIASLNTAREKGNKAAVKGNLASIQAQSALYYDDNGMSYGKSAVAAIDVCNVIVVADSVFADPTVAAAINAAESAGSGTGTAWCALGGSGVVGTDNSQSWAVSVPYKNQTMAMKIWCTDSTGYAGESAEGKASGGGVNPAVCTK
ncbi:type II secretion system GspH family protein [Patescibacteria group bacterium]|nr:type II secretion system GspH family protein [Patescibacteria group bacterium]